MYIGLCIAVGGLGKWVARSRDREGGEKVGGWPALLRPLGREV